MKGSNSIIIPFELTVKMKTVRLTLKLSARDMAAICGIASNNWLIYEKGNVTVSRSNLNLIRFACTLSGLKQLVKYYIQDHPSTFDKISEVEAILDNVTANVDIHLREVYEDIDNTFFN